MKQSYNQFLTKHKNKMERKHLKKALAMIGVNVNDQQADLVIAFHQALNDRGDQLTLGEIDQIGESVNKRHHVKQSLQLGK